MKPVSIAPGLPVGLRSRIERYSFDESGLSYNSKLRAFPPFYDGPFGLVGRGDEDSLSSVREVRKSLNLGVIRFSSHLGMAPDGSGLVSALVADHVPFVLVGYRFVQASQARFLDGVRAFSANQMFGMGMHESADSIMESARDWPALHISLGLDVLDPAFCPNIIDSEPGGLSVRELLYLLSRIKRLKNFYSFDISFGLKDCSNAESEIKVVSKLAFELSN